MMCYLFLFLITQHISVHLIVYWSLENFINSCLSMWHGKFQLLIHCQLQGQVLGDLIWISVQCSRNILKEKVTFVRLTTMNEGQEPLINPQEFNRDSVTKGINWTQISVLSTSYILKTGLLLEQWRLEQRTPLSTAHLSLAHLRAPCLGRYAGPEAGGTFCWVIIRGIVYHSCYWLERERSMFSDIYRMF